MCTRCRRCPRGRTAWRYASTASRPYVREPVIVDALAVVGLNVTLQLSGISQEIIVSAESPALRTADAGLGQTIRNEVYTALPLVMNTGGPRDPTAFMFLMPGVQSVGRWGNVMGGQDFANDTYIEGVPITNAVVQGEGRNLSYGISVEAVEQFQVETSGTAVMFNGQGASNYVVKSGTNTFRGSAFEFFRNKALDSKAFFAVAKPDDNQHEYGATLGGPIRRNGMFFFVAYDGYRDRRQTESRLLSIPTLAMRNGDFSALPVQIYDPATTRPNPNGTGFVRDPFPGNIIPPNRISSISRNLAIGSAGADGRRPPEQLPRRIAADRVQQRQRHLEGRHQRLAGTPAVGALRARLAAPAHALSRRHERADGAASALHGDTARRRDADDGTGQAHLRHQPAMAESAQRRVRAAGRADRQRHDRRRLSDPGGVARPATWRGGFSVSRDLFCRSRTRRRNGAAPTRARSRSS